MKKVKVTLTRDERLIAFNALRFAIQDVQELTPNYTLPELGKRTLRLQQTQIFDRMDWAWHRDAPVKYSMAVADLAAVIMAVLEMDGSLNLYSALNEAAWLQMRNKVADMIKKINQPYYD